LRRTMISGVSSNKLYISHPEDENLSLYPRREN
jgi:hypothetical protein